MPFLQELKAGVDHCRADEQGESQHPAGHAENRRGIDRQSAGQGHQHRMPVQPVRQTVQKDRTHEGRQHDHLARQPRGAPHRGRTPGPLRVPEVKEGSRQPAGQQCQRQQTALTVEGVSIRLRQQLEGGVGLRGEQREKQSLAGADQGGQEDDGKSRMHGWAYPPAPFAGKGVTVVRSRQARPPVDDWPRLGAARRRGATMW